MHDRLENIVESWFLMEPLLFQVWCSHRLETNDTMQCVVRSGKGRIELCPARVKQLTDAELELRLRAEMIRILLKHPYERLPENCRAESITRASECVLTDNYRKLREIPSIATPASLNLPAEQAYEWYAHRIEETSSDPSSGMGDNEDNSEATETGGDESQDGQGNNAEQGQDESQEGNNENNENNGNNAEALAEASALWEEDQLQQQQVNDLIQNTSTTAWGSIAGLLRERIIASTRPQIDYRHAFSGFRSSVLSSRRRLTRMRPNRRMYFDQMGSVYQLSTRLLVAVDVSGSVSTEQLGHFYSLIRRYFKYGIEQMDVVQFDAELGEVRPFKQRTTEIEVLGRGGTSFQPVINYAKEHQYDGLCIMTDGYAPEPKIPLGFHTPLLWVMSSKQEYDDGHEWMESLPHSRACWLRL